MNNNISEIIRKKNLSQGDLAQLIGIRREYLNKIIKGRINPTVPLGIRIAKALEIPLEDLFIIEE